jgi:phosphoribosylformylglycinamidine synthase I
MKCGVVVFPGSNCDHDVYHVWKHVLRQPATFLWHDEPSLQGCELIVLPGGFSYGDYVRAGAMAAQSPIVASVRRHADAGGLVLGVCNGFQILLEAGMLPGAMRRNTALRFLSRAVHLRVERDDLPFTHRLRRGQVLELPIAHGEGNYYDTPARLDELEAAGQVVLRYCTPEGEVDAANRTSNPNGSERAIAGICNREGNVLALMPHPERRCEPLLGGEDGVGIFRSIVEAAVEEVGGSPRWAGAVR